MRQNRGVFFAALFAGVLLLVSVGVSAHQINGRSMSAPRAMPAGPMRSASRGFRSATAPNRRWNGLRSNGSRNLNRTNQSTTSVRTPQAEDGFGFAGAPLSLQQLLNITPTNGFNWQYVNAINQDLPLKAIVDPVTRLEIAQAEHLLRIGGGQFSGAYILGGGYGYYMPEQAAESAAPASAEQPEPEGEPEGQQSADNAQPRVIVLQQKAGTSEAEESAPPTIPDEGPLTLVLRNGQKIDAIAFTVDDAKIVYITPDGTRKTIDTGELDPVATVRLNQENGTPLQLPSSLGNS